jgi:site-specific recombinase XerD
MTRSTGQRRFHLKDTQPSDPAIKRLSDWSPANRNFYLRFRKWLQDGGYSDSSLNIYGCAARLALGWLDTPYWDIDPQEDIDRVREYIARRYASQATCDSYNKGLLKLAEYLYAKGRRTRPEKPINWETYLDSLPEWLHTDIRAYIAYRRRTWLPDTQHKSTITSLSQLTLSLRWMAVHAPLDSIEEIAPALWFDYLDDRLDAGRSHSTINTHLRILQDFLRFLAEQERPVCQRMLRVRPIECGSRLPRDVPQEHIQQLIEQIEIDASSTNTRIRRMGIMDRAWFLLMLYSGLRSGEIRRLRRDDLDLKGRRVRIVQSKGLKDRVVFIPQDTTGALQTYLQVRGVAMTDHVFIYRHRPLTPTYCIQRMRTYGRRCDIHVTPHQLRHCCATFLLNAGAPVLTVQAILGHRYVDTTLRYARLYDGTVAADYYRAMDEIERHLALQEDVNYPAPSLGQLLALVDSLQAGTLNDAQRETVLALRTGLLALAQHMVESSHKSTAQLSDSDPAANSV